MGCTVDHLRAGLSVRVLRDFTDAQGITVKAGDRGVLQQLNLDWKTFELSIEWDREGRREVLRFPHKATTGPRNGKMREFFGVEEEPAMDGEDVELQRAARAASTEHQESRTGSVVSKLESAATAPRKPERPDTSFAQFAGKQPPDNTNLRELTVACDCDPELHRAVMSFTGELSVHACLRCGTVTCTKCVGDDGRFTGDAWHAYFTVAVPDKVLAWLSQWPRVTASFHSPIRWPMAHELVRYDHLCLPADTRCGTAEELAALESRFASEQAGLTNGQRLRKAGFPKTKPPANLPKMLESYAMVWEALQLRPDSPLRDLFHFAQLRSPASAAAVELLLQRPDHVSVMLEALRSDDAVQRSAGYAMALLHKPVSPELAPVILEIMNSLSLEPLPDVPGRVVSCGRFEALLVLIAELKLATPEMFTALSGLQRRLARHDAELVKCIQIVVRELRGEPPISIEERLKRGRLP